MEVTRSEHRHLAFTKLQNRESFCQSVNGVGVMVVLRYILALRRKAENSGYLRDITENNRIFRHLRHGVTKLGKGF